MSRFTQELRFKVIPPAYPYHKRGECEHTLARPMPNGQTRCTMRAMYLINGTPMCERHTGRELIMHHLRQMGIYKLPGDKLG